jgi:hypothetical protein
MNRLMLSFSGADLARLRTLVTALGKETALAPEAVPTAKSHGPRTDLDMTWSSLVEMLDLGAAPQMRECPTCGHQCLIGAVRCRYCWSSLPASNETLAAQHS